MVAPVQTGRLRLLRLVLLAATLSSMLCCIPLWLNTREYPLVPLFPHWLILPAAGGLWVFVLVMASLVAAVWRFRPAIVFFVTATLYLYACDQNRGQAWFYIYWVMLLLNVLPGPTAMAACRLAFSIVYFWAGVQKLNGSFESQVPAWFIQPAADWGWPRSIIAILRACVLLTPFLEIFIGTGVWFRTTRWFAIGIAAILHTGTLLFLGPFGHDVNKTVWPWNIAMIALIIILFGGKQFVGLPETLRELRRSLAGVLIVGLYGLLPILSFFGLWDSYFSFSLYSFNVAKAEVYLSQSCVARLPSKLQSYVYPVKNYNPALQLPYMFEYTMWAEADMGSPPMPEPRGYRVLFRRIASYGTSDSDCLMLLKTRTGRIFLCHPNSPPLELQSAR